MTMADDERERAAYYQAHKDDPDLWDDPEPVYVRIGEHGTEHRIGWVQLPPDPAAIGAAIAELLRSAALRFDTTTDPDPTPEAGQP